jgi:hypothetical protein
MAGIDLLTGQVRALVKNVRPGRNHNRTPYRHSAPRLPRLRVYANGVACCRLIQPKTAPAESRGGSAED